MNRWWVGLGLLAITVGALALRSPQLALRPMHNDEAVNAEKIRDLWREGRYRYDPNEHHGPTLYYFTLPFVWLSGAQDYGHLTEATLRAVSVFFGLVLILSIWLLVDALGSWGSLVAGVLTALSPAMVFYSRYFIHEMLLVCFTLWVIAASWRYWRHPSMGWATLAGTGLGLMYATKETFVLALVAMVGAIVLTRAWNRRILREPSAPRIPWKRSHVAAALLAATLVSLLFFTSFFTNASGPVDSLRTYMPWLKRAGGDSPHIHPWYFYLERLIYFKEGKGPRWSEGLIVLLAVIGGAAALRRSSLPGANGSFARFLTFYILLLTGAYSLISYKTPWCLLGFLQPMILLAGIGAVWLVANGRKRGIQVAIGLLLLLGTAQLSWQAWRASYPFASDRRNPYVYAQTVPDILKLVQRLHGLAKADPAGYQMLVKVMAPESDYWPLPWYLRQFTQVGWWGSLPKDPYAPVMIAGSKFQADFDKKSDYKWLMVEFFELRPKTFLELYVEHGLWEKYVQSLPPNRDE